MLPNLKPICSKALQSGYCSLIRPRKIKYQTEVYPQMKGQYQHWKSPIYESAIVPILERGPDFTFQDGRKPIATSKFQYDRLVRQSELGKKVVQYLADIREIEELHEKDAKIKLQNQQEENEKWKPTVKELKEIF